MKITIRLCGEEYITDLDKYRDTWVEIIKKHKCVRCKSADRKKSNGECRRIDKCIQEVLAKCKFHYYWVGEDD